MLYRAAFVSASLFVLIGIFIGFSCNDSSKDNPDQFDRQAMLRHYADALIKPAYTGVQQKLATLQQAVTVFNAAPSTVSLDSVRTAWHDAYRAWQYAKAYNFGPAGEKGLRKGLIEEVGTFPVSATKMDNSVANGVWNLEDSNRDARGFLAVEYLIYGQNQTPDALVAAFASNPQLRSYLTSLTDNIASRLADVVAEWNVAYYQSFVQNDGTDVGSSTSQLYNEFVRSFEAIKNFKIGLPLGVRPGQTKTEPQLVEAYYSGASLDMLSAHFDAIDAIWHGRAHNGTDGVGFREYLQSVEGGPALITETETQLAAARAALDAIPASPSLSAQIAGDKSKVETFNTEISKLTRFFKSNMSSLLGIAITFSSGDGD